MCVCKRKEQQWDELKTDVESERPGWASPSHMHMQPHTAAWGSLKSSLSSGVMSHSPAPGERFPSTSTSNDQGFPGYTNSLKATICRKREDFLQENPNWKCAHAVVMGWWWDKHTGSLSSLHSLPDTLTCRGQNPPLKRQIRTKITTGPQQEVTPQKDIN